MGGPYAELIRRHEARLFAFLGTVTSSERARASLFAETFRLMADNGVHGDPDVDPDVMVYRYALRVCKRFEVPAPDPASELMRMFEGIAAEDRIAFALLETSGLKIDAAATALRCPEPRLKEALAGALVTITRAAFGEQLEPAAEDATTDAMVAMDACDWLEKDDRALVEADASARPRRAAFERVLGRMRELMPPCELPEGLVAHVDAAVERCLSQPKDVAEKRPRRGGRIAAIMIGAMVVLGGGGFAAKTFLLGAHVSEPEIAEAQVEQEPEPAPEPSLEPVEAPPAIEVAAQGPAAPADPRIEKATAHARAHRCKKAANLFAKIVDASPENLVAAKTALAPCGKFLKKARDKKIAKLARALAH